MGECSIKDESRAWTGGNKTLARRVIRLGRKVNSMKIARPRLPLSINFNSTGGPPTEGAPPLATSVRGLSLKKRALLPSSLPSPSALSFFPGHSARCGCEQKRTKVWGLPRKIVINRRVADLERATFITRVTFVALPLFLSLSVCHPPLKAANCIYELSGRNGWFAEPLARILHRPIVG